MEINVKKNEIAEVQEKNNTITTLLDNKAQETDNVKTAIDILATKTALEQKDTVEKIVTEKTYELKNDAETKRVEAETKRINEEVKRVSAQQEKEIAELDKTIASKKKEIENLNTENDKAIAYFKSNKEILKCVGIRNPLTLKAMQRLMIIASIIFTVFQIILLPLTLIGTFLECVINIIGSICGEIKNNGLKIILSIVIGIIIVSLVVLAYIYGGKAFYILKK